MSILLSKSRVREAEKLLKVLANRRRLAIMLFLRSRKEASVGEIAGRIHLSLTSTSKHLGILSTMDLVEKEQRSLAVYYRVATDIPKHAREILDIILSYSRE